MTPAEQLKAAYAKAPKPAKYRNKKVIVSGDVFDSMAEYNRWCTLRVLQRVGQISELQRQVTFKLEVNGQSICSYRADATYVENGVHVVEDTKSPATRAEPSFRLKAKLMKAIHGIDIKVVP